MSKPRLQEFVERRLEPTPIERRSYWDDQLWPVHATLLVMSAFFAGVAVGTGSFRDPRPWCNPILWLVLIGLATATAIWATLRIPPQVLRRATWLSGLLSVLLHTAILWTLAHVLLTPKQKPDAPPHKSQRLDRARSILPEYALPPITAEENSSNEFDRLVESTIVLEVTETPRSSPSASGQLNHESEGNLEDSFEAATDKLLFASCPPPHRPEGRQEAKVNQASMPLRRRDPLLSKPPTPLLVHVPRNDSQVHPKSEIDHEIAADAARAPRDSLQATRSHDDSWVVQEIARTPAARSPIVGEKESLPTERSTELHRELSRRPTRRRETLAVDTTAPATIERRRLAPTPSLTTAAQRVPNTARALQENSVASFALIEQLMGQRASSATTNRMDKSEAELLPIPLDVSQARRIERRSASQPTLDPESQLNEVPRRAIRVADAPVAAPAPVVPTRLEPVATSEPLPVEPAHLALTRAETGTAGMGREGSFADQDFGGPLTTTTAANAMRRRQESQNLEPASALSPSLRIVTPRAIAQHARPSSTSVVTVHEDPSESAARVALELSQSAAATLEHAAADLPTAEFTAPTGTATVDTGSPRLASSIPARRHSGGGAPMASPSLPQPRSPRMTQLGSPPTSSLIASVTADQPAAPLARGGGQVPTDATESLLPPVLRQFQSDKHGELGASMSLPQDKPGVYPMATQIDRPRRTAAAADVRNLANYTADSRPIPRQAFRSPPFVAKHPAVSIQWAGGPTSTGKDVTVIPGDVDLAAPQQVAQAQWVSASEPGSEAIADSAPMVVESPTIGPPTPAFSTAVDRDLKQLQPQSTLTRQVLGRSKPKVEDGKPAFTSRRTRRLQESGTQAKVLLPRTEQSIERGLQFLARYQSADGRWSLHRFGEGVRGFEQEVPSLRSDTAGTGLALLAFLGAGYHHRLDQYHEHVHGGLQFLLRNQQQDGNLFISEDELSNQSVALYSHGIAALALCEAYGMTQDEMLRRPAQRAIQYIVQTQHPRWGGWRYVPGISADTSVTGWMVMALKSAELSGLEVPPGVYRGVDDWLDAAQASDEQPFLFRYNPYAPDTPAQRHGRIPSPTMTSVGLLSRLYRGVPPEHSTLVRGADYLLDHLPAMGTQTNPLRDTYYWYYATQVMFYMGGPYWQAWNTRLHPLLVDEQVAGGEFAGSWHPYRPVPDRWSSHAGRLYLTSMNLLSLEVYYRHLPLYRNVEGPPGGSGPR